MVRVPPPHRPLSAAPRLAQDYEGHGLHAPFPYDRGYRHDSDRPVTPKEPATRLPPPVRPPETIAPADDPAGAPADAPADAPAPTEAASTRSRKSKTKIKVPTFTIHTHIREKTIPIQAGEGTQCIYWLGATAVRRYVSQPFSYTSPYSEELTCKAIIADDGAHLELSARVRDELEDGAHVWIDVGDGAPLSRVHSRSLPERGIFEPPGSCGYQEQIGWEATPADIFDEEVVGIDPRQTMRYMRTVIADQPSFKEWQMRQAASSSSQDGLFEIFNRTWQQVAQDEVGEMPNASSWMGEVKSVFWHNFESLKYVFSCHASVTVDPSKPPEMSLLEFWAICKRCALPSPWLNLNKINRFFMRKGAVPDIRDLKGPHDGRKTIDLPKFLGTLVRISVLREQGGKGELPMCVTHLIQGMLTLTPGFETFEPEKAAYAPFSSPAVRQKLTMHESRLKKLFQHWAKLDETRETIQLSEFLQMMAKADVMGPDLIEVQLKMAFVHAMLGAHDGVFETWQEAGEQASSEILFSEFVDAIMRVALLKFEWDTATTIDIKVHELCLILIFGPCGRAINL